MSHERVNWLTGWRRRALGLGSFVVMGVGVVGFFHGAASALGHDDAAYKAKQAGNQPAAAAAESAHTLDAVEAVASGVSALIMLVPAYRLTRGGYNEFMHLPPPLAVTSPPAA